MNLEALTAIAPVDGRYRNKVQELAPFFSEYALIKYRVKVEIEYLIALGELGLSPDLAQVKSKEKDLRGIYESFSTADANWVKNKESEINHDVKAVEYFVKERLKGMQLENIQEFVHFGLTSQDINNSANPLMLRDALQEVVYPAFEGVMTKIKQLEDATLKQPMLARTHGQAASPTLLGKEIRVFRVRLEEQLAQLRALPISAKFGGATGNMNAHFIAYPEQDWHSFADRFLASLNLKRCYPSTQIEHYDNFAALCHVMARMNTILIDFSRDVWHYVSIDYFKQKIVKGEVGSSAMPHKVNPIDFENAEGNLGLANALFSFLAEKLPISRLQRDLTDSTVLRNQGLPFGHTLLAYKSLNKGLNKLEVNKSAIDADLESHWEVTAEAIQTVLRSINYPSPYEALKKLTRTGEKITAETIKTFIEGLDINDQQKARLLDITPFNYVGKL